MLCSTTEQAKYRARNQIQNSISKPNQNRNWNHRNHFQEPKPSEPFPGTENRDRTFVLKQCWQDARDYGKSRDLWFAPLFKSPLESPPSQYNELLWDSSNCLKSLMICNSQFESQIAIAIKSHDVEHRAWAVFSPTSGFQKHSCPFWLSWVHASGGIVNRGIARLCARRRIFVHFAFFQMIGPS